MRIGLTGADGFTGPYVVEALEAAGLAGVPLQADIADAAAIEEEIRQKPFDCLIHLAGEAFVASHDWRRFYTVNQLGTMNLLDCVARYRPGIRCILASSAQVYGSAARGLIAETHETRPRNHYAISKLAMELGAQAFGGQLEIVITRPFNYTGRGQQERYLIPKIVDHVRRGASRIELGNVDVRRDFGDVRSVALAYAGLAVAAAPPPIVNICTGRLHSVREIIAVAEALTNLRIAVDICADFVRADDVPELGGDPSRLMACLPAWRPVPIEETLAWMLSD